MTITSKEDLKMDWKEKIKEGMKLIKEGCTEQTDLTMCHKCPFYDFCWDLVKAGYEVPSDEPFF